MKSDYDRIAEHFCATAKCRKRKDAKLQVHREEGVTWICCEHEKCACILNDGDTCRLSDTLAKWVQRHG